MHTTIRRINFFPNNRRSTNTELEQQTEQDRLVMLDRTSSNSASLSKCPRTLYALWNEYEFGLNGQKAAKNFTSREQGKNRLHTAEEKYFGIK